MNIKFFLIILGLVIGLKNKAVLLYIFYIMFPFIALESFKYIGIGPATVFIYMSVIPLLVHMILDTIRQKKLPKNTRSFFIISLLFFVYILLRFSSSVHPSRFSLLETLSSGFIIFMATLYYYDELNIKRFIFITKIIIIVEGISVLLQTAGVDISRYLIIFDFTNVNLKAVNVLDIVRATGTFYDPNYFALYMAAITCSIITYSDSIFDIFIFILGVISLILSFSRMGVIMAIILFLFYFYNAIKTSDKRAKRASVLMIALGFLAFIFLIYFKTDIINNIIFRFSTNYDWYGGGRIFILKSYFTKILNKSNALFGLGFLNFQFVIAPYIGEELAAHNEYVQILADLGVTGILFLLFYTAKTYKVAKASENAEKNPFKYTLYILLFGNCFLTTTFELYIYLLLALYIGYFLYEGYEKLPRRKT